MDAEQQESLLPIIQQMAASVLGIKAKADQIRHTRKVSRAVYSQQAKELEDRIAEEVEGVFVDQIAEVAKRLEELSPEDEGEDKSSELSDDQIHSIVAQVFDPNDPKWQDALVDRLLPVLGIGMLEAGTAQLFQVGIDPKQMEKRSKSATDNRGTFDPDDPDITKGAKYPGQPRDQYGRFASSPSSAPVGGGAAIGHPDPAPNQLELFDPGDIGYDVEEDLDYADGNAHAVQQVLEHYKAEQVEIGGRTEFSDPFSTEQLYLIEGNDGTNKVVQRTGKQGESVSFRDVDEFVQSATEMDLARYFPDYEQRFNDDFWEYSPGSLYHATSSDNVESIMADGLHAGFGSGLYNTWERGVFTSVQSEGYIDSYGDSIIEINMGKMKEDGVTPFVKQEPSVVSSDLRAALGHVLGASDHLDYYSEARTSGEDPNTVIINGDIPPKYLKVMEKA